MTSIALSPQQTPRPAARDDLAAAGPVEPSSSPDLAPGPTFSSASRRYDSADPRRRFVAAIIVWRTEGEGAVPTLAFVPGIVVTGRYRMQPRS
jgi:hypothetical protein